MKQVYNFGCFSEYCNGNNYHVCTLSRLLSTIVINFRSSAGTTQATGSGRLCCFVFYCYSQVRTLLRPCIILHPLLGMCWMKGAGTLLLPPHTYTFTPSVSVWYNCYLMSRGSWRVGTWRRGKSRLLHFPTLATSWSTRLTCKLHALFSCAWSPRTVFAGRCRVWFVAGTLINRLHWMRCCILEFLLHLLSLFLNCSVYMFS